MLARHWDSSLFPNHLDHLHSIFESNTGIEESKPHDGVSWLLCRHSFWMLGSLSQVMFPLSIFRYLEFDFCCAHCRASLSHLGSPPGTALYWSIPAARWWLCLWKAGCGRTGVSYGDLLDWKRPLMRILSLGGIWNPLHIRGHCI